MALTNIGLAPPDKTKASRFFTMVDMNQGGQAESANQEFVTTDLVSANRQGRSTYMPSSPSSAYVAGTINSLLFGPAQSQFGWVNTAPLRNDAIINQQNFLSSLGSVVMSFNLSENMSVLRDAVQNTLPETETRDAITITKEIEKAICESVVKSKEDFVQDISVIYQHLWSETQLLSDIYNDMQFLSTTWNQGFNPVDGVANWEAIANGTDPMRRIAEAGQVEDLDPIAATNLVAQSVTPAAIPGIENTAPLVIQYVETSPVIQNAVLVNNLVITNLPAPMAAPMGSPPPPTRRGSPGPPRRGGSNDY